MLCPETPTLRRKSSNKRIISSPSQELFHFLTLPNPSANENPRQRLHILTPKNKNRSTSSSLEQSKKQSGIKKKPSPFSRVTFIRKKASIQSWGKKSEEVRCDKLRISDDYKSHCQSWKDRRESVEMESSCRLNFTFGLNQYQNWIRI